MKRNFTFLLTALLLLTGMNVWAQSRTSITDVLNRELTGVTGTTYTSWEGKTSNSDAVYAGQSAGGNESIQLRSNNSNSGIITTASGGTITNVTVTWNESTVDGRTLNVYGSHSAYTSPTELYNTDLQGTLLGTIVNGTSTELEITDSYEYLGLRSANGAMYLSEIDITWTTGGTPPQETVAMPTFNPAGGTYNEALSVTISCATEGATIYYTLDGTNPMEDGTVYTNAINITETTTVKAIAMKEGYLDSSIASATYIIAETPSPTPITIAEARALNNNEYALVQGVVTFIDGRNVYIQDETAGIDLFLNSSTVPTNLAIGDLVQAYGKHTVYNGLVELNGINGGNADEFTILSSGNTLPLTVKTIAEVLEGGADALQCTRVKIESAIIGAINTSGNTPLTQDGSSINIYKVPALTGIEEGDVVDVISIIGYFNVPQLRVALADDVTLIETPSTSNLTVTPTTLSGFEYEYEAGGPSEIQYFFISGDQLTHDVSVIPSENFEVSTQSIEQFVPENPAMIYIPTSGELLGIQICVRLKAGLEAGTYNEQIAIVSDEINTTHVSVSGIVTGSTPTPTVATPTFTPAAGTYTEAQTVSITCTTQGANIYYSTVSENGPWTPYSGAILVEESMTIWAYAEMGGYNDSPVAEAFYIIQTGSGSVTIFNQDWEGEMNGWIFFDVDGPASWSVGSYQNNHYAYANAYNQGANEDWCISPTFDLSNVSNAVLTFRTAKNYNGPTLEVLFSENYDEGNPNNATWIQLPCTLSTGSWTWTESGNIDLSDYNSSNCHIGFKYTSEEGSAAGWEVDDIMLVGQTSTTEPVVNVTPLTLSGFTYIEGNASLDEQSFVISGMNLTEPIIVSNPDLYFQISRTSGSNFSNESSITLNPTNGIIDQTIYVRMAPDLAVGTYTTNLIVNSEVGNINVTCSGTVTVQPVPGDDYIRISDVSQLAAGNQIILAARYNETANAYFAIGNTLASGKLPTTEFTSAMNGGDEIIPSEILSDEDNYYWTVGITADGYTFTNANGQMIGYGSSGTNFVMDSEKTVWTIGTGTSEPASLVPDYYGFNIINATTTGRGIALRVTDANSVVGAYAVSNMTNGEYNFFLDIFMQGEGGSCTVAAPTFSPVGGTYYGTQDVTISCATNDASIYYSLESASGPWEEYEDAITVDESMTIWAYAEKEGCNNSPVVEAAYIIQTGSGTVTIFNQDWEGEMNGWTFVNVDGEMSWTVAQYNGNHYAYANGFSAGSAHANEDWCISPAFDLSNVSNAVLTFRTATKFTGPVIEVLFSSNYDGEDPNTPGTIWEPLTGYALSQGNYEWVESGPVSLATMSSTNCHIAFKYTSTDTEAAAWEVDDIMLVGESTTTEPVVNVTPLSLSGFTYIEGNASLDEQSFVISGMNLTEPIIVSNPDLYFQISRTSGSNFSNESSITLNPTNGIIDQTIYVRMAPDLAVGTYTTNLIINSEAGNINVTCSGTVTAQPVPGGDYIRISDVSQLAAGNQIILAARYNETANAYFAIGNTLVSGRLPTTEFTSAMNGGDEIIPSEILSDEDNYYWTVGITADGYTFTNANGQMIGYGSSGTNFAMDSEKTIWTIGTGTSDPASLVPDYYGFNIINATTTNRGMALRVTDANSVVGAYAISNMANGEYNFFLDIFMQGEGGPCTVATPTFSPAGGTYYEAQEVIISCATEGAIIYYSTVSENGPWNPYTGTITISENTTIWAYAVNDDCNDSPIVSAEYIIQNDLNIIFNQDWEEGWHGWTEKCQMGDSLWRIGSYQGNHYAYANGYNHPETIDWLISPAFDLDSYNNVVLTFLTAKNYTGDSLHVYFSNQHNGQDIIPEQWQELECNLSQGGWNWTPSGDISLDDYEGSNCHIAFKYHCTDTEAAGWEVDDIMLVSGSATPTPTLTATPNTISGLDYTEGEGPSVSQSYTLTGANLEGEGNITVTASEYFEISLDDEAYFITLEIPFAEGELVDQPVTIFVRLVEGLEIGTYEGTITHEGGNATAVVNVTGTVHSENEPMIEAYMPFYIQGNNGSNNNRVPVATEVWFRNLEPNTSYRYTNQFVDENDGPETAGAGNVIYADLDGFYRSTSPSLATEGGYGEFTTNWDGDAIVWCINEPTANARFTPGNHVYLRIRINDGQEGTTVERTFTTEDYATVLNFGTEHNANQGTAFYVKSNEDPMTFAQMFANTSDLRPVYSTTVETTGVDFGNINQYADFYKEEVAGKDGWFGGILPNDNEMGINYILVFDITHYWFQDYYPVELYGQWNPNANTVNPNAGLDDPIFIDLTDDGIEEDMATNVKVWSTSNEFVIENGDNAHYSMTVYNILGQPMLMKQINAGSIERISHSLTSGVYVINLQNNQSNVSVKVIVR